MGIRDFINRQLGLRGDSSSDGDDEQEMTIDDWVQSQRAIYGHSRVRECESCQQDMSGSERTEAWEDGTNAEAYIRCRHCGHRNDF